MKKLIFVALLLMTSAAIWLGCNKEENDPQNPQNANNKGSIIGVVTDYATREPVRNANVQLRPTGETTLTGTDGSFEFKNLPDGNYSITVSKAEYTDLIDDYVIEVKNGKTMRRDVQIEKKPTYIVFTDMQDNLISVLDFGEDPSITTKMFNVFNHGTVAIRCQKVYSCNWITSVSDLPSEIQPGQIVQVSVSINRSLLSPGENTTVLTISTNNGSNEITIKATSVSGNPPTVSISPASNITSTSAKCQGQIQNANGSNVTDCGFCYSTSSSPTLNDNCIRLGPKTGAFSFTLVELEHNTTYHVKAFATSILGTGLSSEITFTTVGCMPNCGATYITNIDAGSVIAESEINIEDGCFLTEVGVCWSSSHTPTISDDKISQTLPHGISEFTTGGGLHNLSPNTTYKIRSYAKNEYGDIKYGSEKTFTTLTGLPTVTTSTATLSDYEIITGGNAIENANTEGTTILVKGVCYGTSPNPDLSYYYEHTEDDYGSGPFTSYIPRPSSYNGYIYIRAYATTHFGTAYGNQVQIYIP